MFTTEYGFPLHPGIPGKHMSGILERNGLPRVTLHSLRHTNATLLISGGVDVRTMSGRLGHSQASTTMNIYAETIQSAEAAAAECLDNILLKRPEAPSSNQFSGHCLVIICPKPNQIHLCYSHSWPLVFIRAILTFYHPLQNPQNSILKFKSVTSTNLSKESIAEK